MSEATFTTEIDAIRDLVSADTLVLADTRLRKLIDNATTLVATLSLQQQRRWVIAQRELNHALEHLLTLASTRQGHQREAFIGICQGLVTDGLTRNPEPPPPIVSDD